MNGKSKCKILKEIRKRIAEENDIAYVTSECQYQGECSGTCPKCEAEVRYLEAELNKRMNLGKAIAIAGIAAALVVGSAGCADTKSSDASTTQQTQPSATEASTTLPISGDESTDETTLPYEDELDGEPVSLTEVLMGDMPLPEDSASWN